MNRMIEETEGACLLPSAALYVAAIAQEIATQCEHQHQRMLWNGMARVVAHVRDRKTFAPAILHVDDVMACGGDGNESKRRQQRQLSFAEAYLVGDNDARAL